MPNMNGSNALHILFANFSDDPRAEALVIRLIKAGVDVNHLDDNWLAPIHIAIKKNHISAVELALKINNGEEGYSDITQKFLMNV